MAQKKLPFLSLGFSDLPKAAPSTSTVRSQNIILSEAILQEQFLLLYLTNFKGYFVQISYGNQKEQ